MRLGETEERIPASGIWPVPMHIRSRYARTLAKRQIVADFTMPCATEVPDEPVPAPDREKRIEEATLILRKLRLSPERVADLVARGNPEYAKLWTEYELALDQIAKAWKILAPLGVDPRDIRQAVEDTIRNAFKAKGQE